MSKKTVVGLIGAGAMGAGLGSALVRGGMVVLCPLAGRSIASRERAAGAGMLNAALPDLLDADIVLSVVPPAQAEEVIAQVVQTAGGGALPIIVDGNAVSPETKRRQEEIVTAAGGTFVDGVIIGGPPRDGHDGPRLYLSGNVGARAASILGKGGLDTRAIDGPVGTAAALKMCYGGLNKGITALTTAALLAASRANVDKELMEEFAISQQALLERSRRSVPGMYPKAYRWISEFEEIARFTADDAASSAIFAAIAAFFADRVEAFEGGSELDALVKLLER